MKICSLLPGATEVIATLGLADSLVGISHECDYPAAVKHAPVVVEPVLDSDECSSEQIDQQVRTALMSGHQLYALREAVFLQGRPDLVITQDLCHVCAVTPAQLLKAISKLSYEPQVLALHPTTLQGVIKDVERIGAAAERTAEARQLATDLRARLDQIRTHASSVAQRPRVACLEWLSPLYLAGHWVPEMVTAAGGLDVLGSIGVPSRQITWERLLIAQPDIIVLMPCGFSIERTQRELSALTDHPAWPDLPAVRTGQVFAVDATSYFSRPGPRLLDGVEILAAIFHPELQRHILPVGAHRLTGRELASH